MKNNQLLPPFEFSKVNLLLFFAGIVVIVIGYLLLSIAPWDNPLSRSVAPLVLLLGYLIVFPLAVFHRKPAPDEELSSKDSDK